jgi:peptide/nickel transport system substrate-binding protein
LFEQFVADEDKAHLNKAVQLHPNSHIKVFIPSIPYSYIAKSTNAGLIRSYDNEQGWVYDLAKSHQRVDDYTYIFEMREGLKFQDGTPLSMDLVIKNLKRFQQYPIKYTNIDKVKFDIVKLDEQRFKIVLKKKYEMLLFDLARVYFYSDSYLEKFNPKGEETGSAIKAPGPYGMGPYIIKEGYATGSEQTAQLELVANPYYWNKEYPKIKHITIYTQLNINEAIKDVTSNEGVLDITPIPFNKKLDVLLSKYAKLVISKSTNHFLIYFNLINGNKKLENPNIRRALNQALNQQNLLNFVYKNEGRVSPYTASINYKVVGDIVKKYTFDEVQYSKLELQELLNGLELNVFTQDRFMFLFKGIEFQLKEYGVKLNYDVTTSEKDIYKQLLPTRANQNTKKWDLLMWGDDDWYYQNPWTVFFIYEPDSTWSTIGEDTVMQSYIEQYFETRIGTQEYEEVTKNILFRAKDQAYTLRVPSPNKVIAVNKEVIFKPYQGGIIPLWEIEISKNHWSIRGDTPYNQTKPIKPKRIK